MRIEVVARPEDAGRRVDAILAEQLVGQTRSGVQRLITAGAVMCNGGEVAKNHKVLPGEIFTVDVPEPEPDHAVAQEIPLDIVYEDADLIVINKPQGMVVHPAAGHSDGTLVNALLHHCGESLSGVGGVLRPGIVHRIDRDTSGLLVVAKNDDAHHGLAAQLADHTMYRVYNAVLVGTPNPETGTVNAPIGRDPRERKRMAVTSRGGKHAVTHYRVLERYLGYSLVECRLETGRTHQIRVHMASIGHPVAGDTVYGARRDPLGLEGQCLHARELSFLHPRTGERMTFQTELPDYFKTLLTRLDRTK